MNSTTYFLLAVLMGISAIGHGFEIVYDYNNGDDEDILTTLHDGEYLDCSKDCIDDSFDNECKFCEVDSDLEVWCLSGKLSRSCRQECCLSGRSGLGRTITREEEEFKIVHDYDNSDDEMALTTLYDGNLIDCDKECIDISFTNECKTCELDSNLNVWCRGGRLSRSCRQTCCLDSSFPRPRDGEPEPTYLEVYDYGNNMEDDDTLRTLYNGRHFDCSITCIDDSFDLKCNTCEVENDDTIFCLNGKLNRACRQHCCVQV